MTLWLMFAACVVIQIIFTPLFLKAQWPGICFKSLVYKMVCSSAFVCIGILSSLIVGNTSRYALMMIAGLVLGWIGDYFLHAKSTNTYFAIGFTSFFLGHIVYICCYMKTLPVVIPDYRMFNIPEIVAALVLLAVAIFLSVKFKVEFSSLFLKIAVLFYAVILVTMFTKASALGIGTFLADVPHGIWAAVLLVVGSLGFVLSDASLGLILFGGQKGKKPLKVFNIVTYFAGQSMLAASILFIRG